MALVVKDTGDVFEEIPSGLFPGVCFNVWDLGVLPGYMGKMQHKLVIGFEISERKKEGDFAGQRFTLYRNYTASLSEKANLRKDLESWRGVPFTEEELAGFDIEKLIAAPCALNLVKAASKKDAKKIYTNIAAITRLASGMEKLVPENKREWTPNWIKAILGQTQGEEASDGGAGEAPFKDDIPFSPNIY